jgi:hypothetical protein
VSSLGAGKRSSCLPSCGMILSRTLQIETRPTPSLGWRAHYYRAVGAGSQTSYCQAGTLKSGPAW